MPLKPGLILYLSVPLLVEAPVNMKEVLTPSMLKLPGVLSPQSSHMGLSCHCFGRDIVRISRDPKSSILVLGIFGKDLGWLVVSLINGFFGGKSCFTLKLLQLLQQAASSSFRCRDRLYVELYISAIIESSPNHTCTNPSPSWGRVLGLKNLIPINWNRT